MNQNLIVPNQAILEGVENLIYVPNKTFLGVNYKNPLSRYGGEMSKIYFGGNRCSEFSKASAITLLNSFQTKERFIFSKVGYGTIYQGDIETEEVYLLKLPKLVIQEGHFLDDVFGLCSNVIEGSESLAADPTSSGLTSLLERLSLSHLTGSITLLSERQTTIVELEKLKSFGNIGRYIGLVTFSFDPIQKKGWLKLMKIF